MSAAGPEADTAPEAIVPAELDGGALRNTVLQLASQVCALVFSAGLTIYLVRALGPRRYGVYALALSVSGLLVFPAGLGLPLSIGRFLADHRSSRPQVRAIFAQGMRLQVPAAVIIGAGLFAAAGPIANGYHSPHLGWPLRFAAIALVGQSLFSYLGAVAAAVRRSAVAVWINLIEGAVETPTAIAIVIAGGGAAGAMAGKALGYAAAGVTGLLLLLRLLGGRRPVVRERSPVTMRRLLHYSGAMLVVDITWAAVAQIDVILLGAIVGTAAVGSFGAVMRVMTVLTYLGLATASGMAPRLSLGAGTPDVEGFQRAFRYLVILQGVFIAPTLAWSVPISDLIIGADYHGAPAIMRTLSLYFFIGAPAALITVSVTYMGEVRRRVPIVLAILVGGVLLTWLFIRLAGGVGAAIGDDVIVLVNVGAHLWLCSRLIDIDVRSMLRDVVRVSVAILVTAALLFVIGHHRLAVWVWIVGLVIAPIAYTTVLLSLGEVSVGELRAGGAWLRARLGL